MFQSKSFTWPLFMNLFRMVFITKTVKLTHFQKNWKNTFLVNSKKGKSGKMVFKKKPSKSDINKLTLFYQFMAACKKLEQPNLTILRTRLIFWNLAISIYSNIVVSDHRKKLVKTIIFVQFWQFDTLYLLNRLWQAQINHQNWLFLTF